MAPKLLVKKSLASFLSMLGGFSFLSRRQNSFIFMYHRILDLADLRQDFVQPGMYVSTDTFRSHLQFLSDHLEIVPLDILVKRLANQQNMRGCCSLTFDDGWIDNYKRAFPLLLEFGTPATIFLATGFIGTSRCFWPEEIIFYLKQAPLISRFPKDPLVDRLIRAVEPDANNMEEWYDQVIMELKTWKPQERNALLQHFRDGDLAISPARKLMSWEEAKQMLASGLISFGAHSVNHVILDQVPAHEAEQEIVQSLHDIHSHLGITPGYFAYPNGNFTSSIKTILQQHGFKGAVTTRKGYLSGETDPFELPRIGIHQDISSTVPLLQARMHLKHF